MHVSHLVCSKEILLCSKETTVNSEMDGMMDKVRLSAILHLKLPAHEQCVSVHRCEVFDIVGRGVADCLVFLINYTLDTQMRGDHIKSSIDKVFDLELLTSAHINYPDISAIAFTMGGMEYEAQCGSQSHAKDLIARLEGIMNGRHVVLRTCSVAVM